MNAKKTLIYEITDISPGSAYGRTGVKAPAANTGDGGAGGAGGSGAYEYWRYMTDEFGNTLRSMTRAYYVPGGEGRPGTDGGSGCAVVYWNKEDAE